MEWQTPKTDWAVRYNSDGEYIGDYWNVSDYLRIKNNLLYLKELAKEMYPPVTLPQIPDVMTNSYVFAYTINVLEESLDALAKGTYDPGIPPRKTWDENAPTPSAEDINRIESSCLALYKQLWTQKNALHRLPLTIGGVQF